MLPTCLFLSDVPGDPAEGDTEDTKKFKTSDDVAFYRCVFVCFLGLVVVVARVSPLFYFLLSPFRRQMEGPTMKHLALLDTVVLTERGARLQLLESDSEVCTQWFH